MSASFAIALTDDHAELPRLAEQLAAWCKDNAIPGTAIHHLTLALDELVTNTIDYGFTTRGEHTISVTVWQEHDRLVAEITDAGGPFDPFNRQSQPDLTSAVADRPIGGLGIYLVQKVMDSCRYHREGEVNITRISKFYL